MTVVVRVAMRVMFCWVGVVMITVFRMIVVVGMTMRMTMVMFCCVGVVMVVTVRVIMMITAFRMTVVMGMAMRMIVVMFCWVGVVMAVTMGVVVGVAVVMVQSRSFQVIQWIEFCLVIQAQLT